MCNSIIFQVKLTSQIYIVCQVCILFMIMKNYYEEMLNKFYIYVQYFIDLCIKSMFTLALVIFKINILNIKYDRTSRPKSLSL